MDRRVFRPFGLLFLCSAIHFCAFSQSKDCKAVDDLQVEVTVDTQNGSSTVKLKFDDHALNNYAIWMLTPKQDQKIFKGGVRTFERLEPGDYEFIIVDRNGCTKKIDVKVK